VGLVRSAVEVVPSAHCKRSAATEISNLHGMWMTMRCLPGVPERIGIVIWRHGPYRGRAKQFESNRKICSDEIHLSIHRRGHIVGNYSRTKAAMHDNGDGGFCQIGSAAAAAWWGNLSSGRARLGLDCGGGARRGARVPTVYDGDLAESSTYQYCAKYM
jgi:hypothetical protein